jgi:hypothetical protein
MIESGLITQIASLGLGAVIAVVVLMWKRSDDARHETYQRETSERLFRVVENNTAAMVELERTLHNGYGPGPQKKEK